MSSSTQRRRSRKSRKSGPVKHDLEMARRQRVAKITPASALSATDFLNQYEEKYKGDSSTSSENSEAENDQSNSEEEEEEEEEDDSRNTSTAAYHSSKKGQTRQIEDADGQDSEDETGEQMSPDQLAQEEAEVDELVALAEKLEGTERIDDRFSKLKQNRVERAEKRRLDELNGGEPWHRKFCRFLTCQPRPGTVPTLKEQRRWMNFVKNEDIAQVKRGLRRLQPPNYAGEDGKTALWSAAFTGNTGLAHLLCDFDADPELGDSANGHRPMHVAALSGWADVIDILLDRRAQVDSRDHRNRTPLHLAAGNGNLEALRVLLDHGTADIKLTDDDGWNCMHHAAFKGRLLALDYLERAGAFNDTMDKFQKEPYDYAVENKHETAALMLSDMRKGRYERKRWKSQLYPDSGKKKQRQKKTKPV